jgi:hypothetical protein
MKTYILQSSFEIVGNHSRSSLVLIVLRRRLEDLSFSSVNNVLV